jgi:hypothetical protein
MNRREFMMLAAASAAVPAVSAAAETALEETKTVKPPAPERNRRPYRNLDWKKVQQIKTTSHGHCIKQKFLDAYLKRGFGFLTISNYRPSAPYWPLKKMTSDYYHVHHDHALMVNGKLTPGPFNWNEIIAKWKHELKPAHARWFPFKGGGKVFNDLPAGMLEAPNAEHFSFYDDDGKYLDTLHLNSLGSTFATGTFDIYDCYLTGKHGYRQGCNEKWRTAVDKMIAGLIHPGGGGITINHPNWSKLDRFFIAKMLDHDPRVLGVEVLEAGYNSEYYWDWILATGRQCFGFFVPDWSIDLKDFGVNVLCVEERTVEACLKAYREGNFYGAAHGLDELKFTALGFNGKRVAAMTDKPARFEIITARGVVKESKGQSVTWDVVPNGVNKGPRVDVYARVKAYATDGSGEVLFSQPFMLY